MTGRTLLLLGLFGTTLAACTQGTSGWVLSEAGGGGTSAAGDASQAGEAGVQSEGGAAGAATSPGGDAGAAGSTPLPAARCPARFEHECSPPIVVDNQDAKGSGQLFDEAVTDPAGMLDCITRDVCDILLRRASEVKALSQINVLIESYDGVSETYSSGTGATIHLSSRHLQDVANAHGSVLNELQNIFYYHATNMYQYDDGDGVATAWLVQGVANYVRHSAGYLSDSERQHGGSYDAGGNITGFFLVWLEQQYPDFVYELNQSMTPYDPYVWSPQAFADITGRPVDQLWATYQASF